MRWALPTMTLAAAALAGVGACQDVPFAQRCTNIPAGGCPLDGPSVCSDITCEAVYRCNPDRTWTRDSVCPAREAGLVDSAVRDAAPPPPRDAALDVQGATGGPGCLALEPPDCPLGTALSCPSNACCGCDDLFVCADGGWTAWGTCAGGTVSAK